MDKEFIFIALAGIAACSTATTEGIKKLLDEAGKKYAPNLLAAITSVVFTAIASVGYIIYSGMAVDAKVVVEAIAMVYLSFLCSTIGFDKIKQMILQISQK